MRIRKKEKKSWNLFADSIESFFLLLLRYKEYKSSIQPYAVSVSMSLCVVHSLRLAFEIQQHVIVGNRQATSWVLHSHH